MLLNNKTQSRTQTDPDVPNRQAKWSRCRSGSDRGNRVNLFSYPANADSVGVRLICTEDRCRGPGAREAAQTFDRIADFLEHFEGLDDPRQRGKVLYPLDEILPSIRLRSDEIERPDLVIVPLSGSTANGERPVNSGMGQ